jgi:integrase
MRSPSILRFTNPSGKKVFKIRAQVGTRNGKPIFTQRTAATITEAKKIQKEFIAAEAMGTLNQVNYVNVFDYGLFWIREVKTNRVRPSTAANYEERLRRDIGPYLGGVKVTELTAKDIERWMQLMKAKGKKVSTVNGARRVLFGIMKYAERAGVIHRNPVALTDAFSKDPHEVSQVQDPWTMQEARLAMKAARYGEFDLAVILGLNLGLRRGELLGLSWDDIDLEKGIIAINGTLKEEKVFDSSGKTKIRLVKDPPKTKSSRRVVGITWIITEAIQRHKEYVENLRLTAASKGLTWQNTNWVFVSASGNAYFPSNFRSRYSRFLKTNGIRHIRIHDLRHTTGHLALESGLRLESLQEALGHSRLETTKNLYASKVSKLAIEFPSAFAEALMPLDEQIKHELNQEHWMQ